MIDKLLDIARLDSGQTTAQFSTQKLQDLLKEYYESHYSYVISQGFKFELDIEPNLPEVVADPDHFETIVSNLVDNAVKYSFDEKYIKISLKRTGNGISLIVRDKGIGIPKKSHSRIFEKFYRLEDSMTAKTKGHGLGLSIVKSLVELNNGTIHIESTPNEGTTFIVEFPIHDTESVVEYETDEHYDYLKKELQTTEYVK
jgi:signal transduction histidine kinase